MAIITLTTDWGYTDYFLAAVKGSILKRTPQVQIIDICHEVPHFDLVFCAFTLKNTWHTFPEGTVHIIGVNSMASDEEPFLVVSHQGHYFIGTDNGIFSLILDEMPVKMRKLENIPLSSFPTRDIFVPVACHLAGKGKFDELGEPYDKINEKILLRPVTEEKAIRGNVTYVDSFKNLVTNISRELFESVGQGKSFQLFFRSFEYSIEQISELYTDVPEGEKLAFFNSAGFLEIAINKGPAATLLGVKFGDYIRIEFNDNKDR
jgi:S-adenosyl-L-methionine hydrolase (adenosine-forming)